MPALPVAALLARWTARRGRALIALGTVEVQLASLVFYVSLNDRLYGGFTPLAVADDPVTGTSGLGGYVERLPRLAALWVQREAGLLRWAPVLALAFLGAWLLWRSRRERLGRLVAERRDAEHAAFLALAVCAGQVAVAVLALPRIGGLPGAALAPALPCAVPLVAWGLRHAPRAALALGALTLAGTVWLAVDGRPVDGAGRRRPVGPAHRRLPARRTPVPCSWRPGSPPRRSPCSRGAAGASCGPRPRGMGARIPPSCRDMTTETTRTRRLLDALRTLQRRNDEEWIRRIESSSHQQHLLHGRRFS